MATSTPTISRFHNLFDAALADELGRFDSISKAAEAELKALKDEFKARGLPAASGDAFMVTATDRSPGVSTPRPCAIFSARPIHVSRSR